MLGCEGISGTQNRMPGGLGLKIRRVVGSLQRHGIRGRSF